MYTRDRKSAAIGICLLLAIGHSNVALATATPKPATVKPPATATPPAAAPPAATSAPALPPAAEPPGAAPPPAAASAAAASTAAPSAGGLALLTPPLTAVQAIKVLDQTVDWYRTLGTQQQAANEPSDLLFFYDNRQIANKVINLAFDIARADADILSKRQPTSQEAAGDTGVSLESLAQYRQKLDAQSASVRAQLESERRELGSASKTAKPMVAAKISELSGVLNLLDTKKNILNAMTDFVAGAGYSSAGSLRAQIDAMAVSVPSAAAPTPAAAVTTGPAVAAAPATGSLLLPASTPPAVGRFGLWDLAANVFRLSEKTSLIGSIDQRTAALQTTVAQIRAPLLKEIKGLSAQGDALATRADPSDSAALNAVHDQFDALTDEFKQTSAMLLPLSRESSLLSQYRRNLNDWRKAIDTQFQDALKVLGVRLALVSAVLGLLFAAAELWRRMVMRYIHDSRRRYQLLLLRRIALWSLVVAVICVSFASELNSIVTFAGLITAGLAVAMQSVLVSIVGYFFLIGKYGIRVGDRVQIGDVAGEVIDLGLVRMHLMELGAKGTMGPTGRVVAFANSVVFQVSSGLFKQIPGVNFAWREVILSLPPGVDYAAAKERLCAAVTDALKDYRAEILRQTQEIERTTLSNSMGDSQPQVQLHFAAGVVEAYVRYPVHLAHAAEIDERVTEALSKVVADLAAGVGSPGPAAV